MTTPSFGELELYIYMKLVIRSVTNMEKLYSLQEKKLFVGHLTNTFITADSENHAISEKDRITTLTEIRKNKGNCDFCDGTV